MFPAPALLVAAAPANDQSFVYQLVTWLGGSDQLAHRIQAVVLKPLEVVLIVFVAYLLARLGSRMARSIMASVQAKTEKRSDSHRAGPRVATVGALVASLWKSMVWVVAILIMLGTLGVDLVPLLAGATVIGAALGFGAQGIVKDFLAGFFIVAEDQYGIGDSIKVGDISGVVEELSLRVTRLRGVDGTVWYLANGDIRQVGNTSIQWSRAIVDIVVPMGTDPHQAMATILQEASSMPDDPDWSNLFLDRPEAWGVDSMGSEGITLRLAVRTPARQNARVAGEVRARVIGRLTRDGVLASQS